MKNYDYHRPAEKVLLDSYRKQNRNKNRLLFLAVALNLVDDQLMEASDQYYAKHSALYDVEKLL